MKTKSDGGETSYYNIPSGAQTLNDLMYYRDMSELTARIFYLTYIFDKEVFVKSQLNRIKNLADLLKASDTTKHAFKYEEAEIPLHASELRHLISHANMSKSRGDIFKSCYRLGVKEGIDDEYDINKIQFFAQDLIEMFERGEHI